MSLHGKASPMSLLPPLPSSPLSSHKFYTSHTSPSPHQPSNHLNQHNDPYYYDEYYSSDSTASSSHIRSGSNTPIQIEKIDHRMEKMERQLEGLSSLVHSALINSNINPSTKKDILKLRKQIMDLQPFSKAESDDDDFFNRINDGISNSIWDSTLTHLSQRKTNMEETREVQLQKILKETHLTQNELKQLKRQAEVNIIYRCICILLM